MKNKTSTNFQSVCEISLYVVVYSLEHIENGCLVFRYAGYNTSFVYVECLGMRATAQALFMFGVLLGSYGFGKLSDKFGRKKSFFISVVIQVNS